MYKILLFLLVVISSSLSAQENQYQSILIDPELTANANAVVRNDVLEIEIEAVDKVRVRRKRIVTVLNEYGDRHVAAYDHYDDHSKIRKQSAVIYDKLGKEIKKYKRKHFEDRSSVDGGTLISDDRVKYIDYTARDYPYTVVYESEVERESTVFLNAWRPVSGFYVSVENSSYSIKNPAGIPLRFEEKNLEGMTLDRSASDLEISYNGKKIPAFNYERLNPGFWNFAPHVLVALNHFSLAGVEGRAENWSEFGKWQYDNLLQGRGELPAETIAVVAELTADAEDDIEKARRIYKYMQDNTRYISVQLGIGGWEPMEASEVDQVKYGDCKALTNFTKALLDSQNIESYYTIVHGGADRVDIDRDFASMQGNHVILNIPSEEEDIWLECTSQTDPFNYLGDFTDNRDVLLIKPEGGEIIRTKAYTVAENLQESFSRINLQPDGSFEAEVKRISHGVPYGNVYALARATEKDQVLYYRQNWGHLKNMDFSSIGFDNDKTDQKFTENLSFSGEGFTSRAGNRLLLPLNFFIPDTYSLPRDGDRKLPLEIARGRTYKDTFEFLLPEGFESESIPEDVVLENDFGRYELAVNHREKEGAGLIEVKRTYVVNEGLWPAESYGDFREFMNTISALNNQKAVIIATNQTN